MVLSCLPGVQSVLSCLPGASLVPRRLSSRSFPASLVPPWCLAGCPKWSFPASLVPPRLSKWSFPASWCQVGPFLPPWCLKRPRRKMERRQGLQQEQGQGQRRRRRREGGCVREESKCVTRIQRGEHEDSSMRMLVEPPSSSGTLISKAQEVRRHKVEEAQDRREVQSAEAEHREDEASECRGDEELRLRDERMSPMFGRGLRANFRGPYWKMFSGKVSGRRRTMWKVGH